MNIVAIPNIDVKVWTWKREFPQGDFLHSLTQPKITRQRPFELTDIEYDLIKDKIPNMERVEYNTDVGINVINVDDIEDYATW